LPDFDLICLNIHLGRKLLSYHLARAHDGEAIGNAVKLTGERLEELRLALNTYSQQGPVLLAGDFNLPAHYPDISRATAGLKECYAENGYGWGKTGPAWLPAFRIDMVFVPGDAEVFYASTVPTRLSDHRMMLAEAMVPIRRSGLTPPGEGVAAAEAAAPNTAAGR
jgi:endonuclease/exonuclease/phosphatase (EEP) superfamily protein YafD